MPGRRSFTQRSIIAATPRQVWDRVITPEGINDEMRPWMTMSVPRGLDIDSLTIDTLPLGTPLGRAWLRLFGVVPFDYDHLSIAEVEEGRRFREESTMLSLRHWTHERTLTAEPSGGTTVTDVITFTPRLGFAASGPIIERVLAAFFRHRHRRLRAHFE